MNGAKRAPLEDRSNVRNRVPVNAWIEVEDKPFRKGRSQKLPAAVTWTAETMAWWESLRTMPHAILWAESDWAYARTTALLHNFIWGCPADKESMGKAGELRMRERIMGVTEESRRDLRIRYVKPGADAPVSTHRAPVLRITEAPTRARPRPMDPDSVVGK